MIDSDEQGRRLYRVRGADGEDAWVDHDELWRLQQGQAQQLRRERARRQRRLLLVLAGMVVAALVLVMLRLRGAGEAPSAVPTTAEAPAAAEPSPPADEPAGEPALPPAERVAEAVRTWAAAWARQDVPAYLAGYAAGFTPAEGLGRSGWERLRRERLESPASIRVEIEGLEVALRPDGRAEARFLQTYVSPDYSDVVRKTLVLGEEEGEWRILAELSTAP